MTQKIGYAEDKTFVIPSAFTALNGCAQTFELTAGVDLVVEPVLDEGKVTNAAKVKEAQDNLLRVLEILRSNGAQPIITKVEGKKVTFTLEQAHVYGKRDHAVAHKIQVSERDHDEDAKEDIKEIFGEAKAVDRKTKLFASVEVISTIGSLV